MQNALASGNHGPSANKKNALTVCAGSGASAGDTGDAGHALVSLAHTTHVTLIGGAEDTDTDRRVNRVQIQICELFRCGDQRSYSETDQRVDRGRRFEYFFLCCKLGCWKINVCVL